MRRSVSRLLLISLLAVASACVTAVDITKPPDPVPPGAMAYTGYDDSGTPVIEGWVLLDIVTVNAPPSIPSNVTGTWNLRRVNPDGEVGPQVGQGTLEGLLQGDQLFVNFNPSSADDNVVGDGMLKVIGDPASGTQWDGTWTWSDLSGPIKSGTFHAQS